MNARLEAAHEELTNRVMGRPGVSGTAIGESWGKPCLVVYVTEERVGVSLPRTVGGFRVEVKETGRFRRH
jgi:hypothetical protein